MSMISI